MASQKESLTRKGLNTRWFIKMFNEICPHCKKAYMEEVYFCMDEGCFEGLFKCVLCLKETYIIKVAEEIRYEYPFEGGRWKRL